ESILQMLTDRGARLETFIIENVRVYNYNEVYGLWTKPRYASILNTLIRVEVHFPFMNNDFIKPLAENCTRLSHLDINIYNDYNNCKFAEESINSLEKLISAQRYPLNLRLELPNGPGDMLIKAFQSRLESFNRLELIKWNFSGCDWSWLNNCPNLTEFAITNSSLSRILSTEHRPDYFKPSKNNWITEHLRFYKSAGISSMPKFYFHPTVIQRPLRIIHQPENSSIALLRSRIDRIEKLVNELSNITNKKFEEIPQIPQIPRIPKNQRIPIIPKNQRIRRIPGIPRNQRLFVSRE
ncbi:6143_t:CDS:2, partial [Diversispora eburnea]